MPPAAAADPDRIDQFREDVFAFYRSLRRRRASYQLTATQWQALAQLDRGGPMTARTLAALEQVAPQSIARTLASLESEGLISRTVDPDDARANIVVVTAVGHQTLVDNRAIRNEWLETALVQRCSAEERELLLIAGRLLRRLAETPEPADGEALSMRS